MDGPLRFLVTVTSGFISILSPTPFPSPVQLNGTDGVLSFSLTGVMSSDSGIALRNCVPCPPTATTISLVLSSSGMDLTGTVTYGNDSYGVGHFGDTLGSVNLQLNGSALFPPPPSMTN